jgi:hypothetical protein
MKKNMGSADRIIRTIVAVVIGVLLVTGRVHGALAIILGVIAVAFLVTSAFGVCPVYVPLKLSTCKPAAPENK